MRRTILTLLLATACVGVRAESSRTVADAIAVETVRLLQLQADRHWHKGDYCRIVNLNKMFIAAYPDFTDAYANAGWLLWSMDRDDEAVALYDQGIAANPDSYALYYEKGYYMLLRKKDMKQAVELLEKAVSKKDCAPIVRHSLAHAYEKSGQLERALQVWQQAAEDASNPGRGAARANLERVRRLLENKR